MHFSLIKIIISKFTNNPNSEQFNQLEMSFMQENQALVHTNADL